MTLNHQSSETGIPALGGIRPFIHNPDLLLQTHVGLYFSTFFEIRHGSGLALANGIGVEVMCVSPRWKIQEPMYDASCFLLITTEIVEEYVEMENL